MSTVYSLNIATSAIYTRHLATFTTVFVSPLTATRRQKTVSICSIKSVVEIETADPSVSRVAG